MKIAAVIFAFMLVTPALHTECVRILGAFHYNGKSHHIVFEALMKALAARGHEVVVLSHFPLKIPVPNYTDIDVSGSATNVVDNITIDSALNYEYFGRINIHWEIDTETCQNVMNHPKTQELLKSKEKFDLVITEIFGSECTIGFAWKFDALLIQVITSISFPWAHARIGSVYHPAYIPNFFLPYTSKMNFWQRLTNSVCNVALNIGHKLYSYNPATAIMRQHFGQDVPSVEELAKNTSLLLVNNHFSVNSPRPVVPAYVEVGGLHIKEPKNLSQDLQKFFDESIHGVVYFNMGSLIQVQSFPSEKLKALTDAFGALPERVLMKYTGDTLAGKPENVMISKWIPQQDVLNHPKTKVFISHGGLGGTQEAVYAGVPIIGVPLFGDQKCNIQSLSDMGMATILDYEDITKDTLIKAIRTVIDNQNYSESAKKMSARFRDRPMTALDTAVYWVEYVIRHRGAPHLRSAAADMPLYQYLLIDVIGFLLLVTSTSIYIVYWAVKTTLRTLTNTRSTQSHGKSKHE